MLALPDDMVALLAQFAPLFSRRVWRYVPVLVAGARGFKKYTEELRRAFPDLRFTIHEIVAQSETVVTHYTATGTHRGPLPGTGIPPTGKSFSITGFVLGHVDTSNKFRDWFATWDTLGQMQQLGLVPRATLPGSAQTPQPGTQP